MIILCSDRFHRHRKLCRFDYNDHYELIMMSTSIWHQNNEFGFKNQSRVKPRFTHIHVHVNIYSMNINDDKEVYVKFSCFDRKILIAPGSEIATHFDLAHFNHSRTPLRNVFSCCSCCYFAALPHIAPSHIHWAHTEHGMAIYLYIRIFIYRTLTHTHAWYLLQWMHLSFPAIYPLDQELGSTPTVSIWQ